MTAVFAGLLTKVGIYAILRLETLLFPASQISNLLLAAAALSLLIGIFGAVAQTDLKRVLSFTLVSHMGYMLFGIGMVTQMGMAATIYYVAHHITVQSTLFLAAGLIEHRGGTTNLIKLGGLQKLAPVIAVLFFIPAMNLAGIPPFSGFIGKVGLIEAGIAYDRTSGWILIAISVITSLLTLYAIAKIWNRAFWQEPSEEIIARDVPLPKVMGGATAAMIAFSLVLTVLAGPLMTYADEAASTVLERVPYVSAVLGDEAMRRSGVPDRRFRHPARRRRSGGRGMIARRLTDLRHSWLWMLLSVALWCLLWGGIDLKNLLGGLAVAVIVFVLFPMPPTGHELTLRPLRFAQFTLRFFADCVVSAVQVGYFALRPGPQPPSSVIAVTMASRSDFFLTFTGVLCTLVPGSVVVEAQRATGTLFLHTFNAGTPEAVEKARASVLAQEERLLRAVGRREVLEEAGLR